MRKLHKIVIVSILFFSSTIFGQKIDNEKLITEIKGAVTQFFIQQGVLVKTEVKDNLDYVFINKIPEGQVLGFSQNGIYLIGVHQSHSDKHILIKEGSKYKIYDLKKVVRAIQAIIDYSERTNVETNTMLDYLKLIIQRYEDNYNYKQVTFEKRLDK